MAERSVLPGSLHSVGDCVVMVDGALTLDRVLVTNQATGMKFECRVSDLAPIHKTDAPCIESHQEIVLTQAQRRRFQRELRALRELAALTGRTKKDVDRTATKLRMSRAKVYRLIRLVDDDTLPEDLAPRPRGRAPASRHLDSSVEVTINLTYEELIKKRPVWNEQAIIEEIRRRCGALGKKKPSRKAIVARIRARNPKELMTEREGSRAANQTYTVRGNRYYPERALSRVQMDPCLVDIIIVDEDTREPLQRPWVTLSIDVKTRVITGVHLHLSNPSGMTTALALANGVLPKDAWLRGIEADDVSYPIYGRPEEILVDNARELRGDALKNGCAKHKIKLKWRPVRRPHFGGHIERLIGTMMGKVHFLVGSTNRSVAARGNYDPEKHAAMTFREFRAWFVREIEIYHRTPHRALRRMTPLDAWQREWETEKGLQLPSLERDPRQFLIDFMPFKVRTINREGIFLHGDLRYWSPGLGNILNIGDKVPVHYDPDSLRLIFVDGPSGSIEVPYADLRTPDVTLVEWKTAGKRLREAGDETSSAKRVALITKNRALVDNAISTTKRARKVRERQKLRERDKSHPLTSVERNENDAIDYSKPVKPFVYEPWD